MLCEVCKKNEANVHITKIVNGTKYDLNMCEKCAKEKGEFSINDELNFASPFTFQNMLSGIMDYMGTSGETQKIHETSCDKCGSTYSEFKKRGLVGCSKCYETFIQTLTPIIKRVQGNLEHTGKIPNKAGKEIIERKKLLKLKEDLQKAIATEEYEKAAEIRDKIKQLQKD